MIFLNKKSRLSQEVLPYGMAGDGNLAMREGVAQNTSGKVRQGSTRGQGVSLRGGASHH